jgi:hypothetical protein
MADPVSWLMIEPGWTVIASDGEEVGKVQEIVGDTAMDIFDGLAIKTGVLGKPRYVPAEQVDRILEGRIELKVNSREVERLGTYEEPAPSERILPERASLTERLAGWFRGNKTS